MDESKSERLEIIGLIQILDCKFIHIVMQVTFLQNGPFEPSYGPEHGQVSKELELDLLLKNVDRQE